MKKGVFATLLKGLGWFMVFFVSLRFSLFFTLSWQSFLLAFYFRKNIFLSSVFLLFSSLFLEEVLMFLPYGSIFLLVVFLFFITNIISRYLFIRGNGTLFLPVLFYLGILVLAGYNLSPALVLLVLLPLLA